MKTELDNQTYPKFHIAVSSVSFSKNFFLREELKHEFPNSTFNESGIGFGLIDAVTKKLYVNKKSNEGEKLNQMFLSECITS